MFVALSAAFAVEASDTVRVIVKYKHMPSAALASKAKAFVSRPWMYRVKQELREQNALAIDLPASDVAALKADRDVDYVEPDAKRYPMALTSASAAPYKTGQKVPYGIKLIQADRLPRMDANAGNRKICIIDSGYDRNHEDLAANNVTGVNDPSTGNWYDDGYYHGTHIAGTIAAVNNSGIGVVGVLPNRKIKLFIVKVFDENGDFTYSSSIVAAANKCANNGAKVINLSLGGPDATTTEKNAFANLLSKGIVSVAAAGNDGNTALSYPASYPSVISVAAVNQYEQWASFSQYNGAVDLAAPGVQVYSAVPMGTARTSRVNVGGTAYPSFPMDGSPAKAAKARLYNFGLGDKVRTGASGQICLIKRGNIEFRVKVRNCERSGGIGAIVYNNVSGSFQGTLGTTVTSIPSVSVSDSVGLLLKSQIGSMTNVAVKTANYDYFTGTSMSTPHVSAVAALVWSYYPACSATQIRTALFTTALDLGTGGRDNKTGYGLVQAKAAYNYLRNGCNG